MADVAACTHDRPDRQVALAHYRHAEYFGHIAVTDLNTGTEGRVAPDCRIDGRGRAQPPKDEIQTIPIIVVDVAYGNLARPLEGSADTGLGTQPSA